jgi:predicted GNAT family N-acyltransferase
MFYPTGVASNPAKFNDFIYFRVHDVSNNGFRILTSMRNKFVMPGVMLDCIISFPMVSQISTTVQVMNLGIVSEYDKDYLAIGVQINEMTPHQSNVIAQYLAQFGDVDSFSGMKAEGFSPTWLNKAFRYSFVNSATEYEAVLQLRHAAYLAEGKISSEASVAEMSDIYDARSRIVICRKGDTLVGTARVSFHEYSDTFEHEEFVRWPTNLPRRDESVEITRLCTHPEFQGAGVIFSLVRFSVITAVQGRRNWVVSSATSDLVPLYESVGLKSVDITFSHPFLNHLKHHMLVGNIEDAMLGRTSGPIAWNLVWKDAFAFMVDQDFITIDIVSRVRLALYRSIGPLIPMLRRLTSSRAKRKA